MPILGLIGTEQFNAERFKNIRRSVFYQYPNGAAPLTGILSLTQEEPTNDPVFAWWEKRFVELRSTTAAISGNVVFFSSVSADGATWTAASADFSMAAQSQYGVRVANATFFRVGHVIRFFAIVSGAAQEQLGRVTIVDTTNNRIAFVALRASGTITFNAAAGVGQPVIVVGSAHAQGATGASPSPYNKPIMLSNYTQIFRTPFRITGTALATALRFDQTGAYKDMAKEASLNHMIEMEKAFIFGERTTNLVDPWGNTNAADGAMPVYTTGGILWFLRQWELTSNNPYGVSGATSDTDDNKRIIVNSSGTVTESKLDTWYERVFRTTNNKSNEKLALCGNGALNVINQLYRSKSVLNTDLPAGETWGMNFVKHVTPFGTIYYKTHPLFNMDPQLRNSMLIVDVGYLRYRYVQGRDTTLLKNRQPNNADYREDEWLTECGLELRFPEAFMFIQNMNSVG